MVVHPSAGHSTGTLVHAILAHAKDISGIGGVKRPGIVHRLDKDTSGALVVSEDKGRMAISEYKTIESFPKHSLLEVKILTGRTHQIRLHLAYLNCPVVGDRIYGFKKPSLDISRQLLHASKLTFELPSGEGKKEFTAPLPDDFNHILKDLRR